MDGFDADPVDFLVCGSRLGQISEELRTELGTLQRDVDDLLAGQWQGAAATGFAKGWELWLRGATDVLDGLATMSELLGEAGLTYQHVDVSSAVTVQRSGVRV